MGAIGDPYASVGDLAFRLDVEEDPGTFPELLDAASRAVESFTRRQFNKATSATARRFRPVDWRRLPVDDFHTVTGLAVDVDGTVWDLANVDPRPWNGTVNGQPGWPFFDLVAVNRYWSPSAVITVTAQWGWTAVPQAVKQATLDIAAGLHGSSSGQSTYPVRSEAVAGYSVTYEVPSSGVVVVDRIPPALVPYQRRRFGVA